MDKRLVPLNAFIAMCTPGDLYPAPLATAGFRLVGLEVPVTTSEGSMPLDAVAFNVDSNTILVGEAKSGSNVDLEQAEKLAALKAQAVVTGAGIDIRKPGDISIEVCYVVDADHLEGIEKGVQRAVQNFPVLAVSEDAIQSAHGVPFADDWLQKAFSVAVPTAGVPVPRYVDLDHQSDDQDFDDRVRSVLVAELSQEHPMVSSTTLVERVVPYYPYFVGAAKGAVKRKVESAARRVCDQMPGHFRFHARSGAQHDVSVELLDSPESADRRGRTQRYQAMARAADGERRRRRPRPPGQGELPLFDDILSELGAGEEESEDEDGGEDEHEAS